MAKIEFENENITVEIRDGSEFTELFDKNPDLPLKFGCRRGCCGVCAVEVVEGEDNLTKKSDQESETLLKKGLVGDYRLCCQCAINGAVTIKTI
ncbi:MAG: Ferredoxin-1 [Chlamydiae bacterium]|nr:Ferredoxin-1 [Chlamydiota bacterium]